MAPMSSDTMLAPETGKTPSFTESFHISDHSATGHSDHRVDDGSHRTGTSITIAGKRTLLHWPFKTQMAVTSPDAMSSSGRTSSPLYALSQSPAGRSFHHIGSALRCIDTHHTVIPGEIGASKSFLMNSTANVQMAPISPCVMPSSPDAGRTMSTDSLHVDHISVQSATSHQLDRVDDVSHRAGTRNTTTVGGKGARRSSWIDLSTSRTQTAPSSRSPIMLPQVRALSTSNISDQSIISPNDRRVGEASSRSDTSKDVRPAIGETGASRINWLNWFKTQMASFDATPSSGRTPAAVHTLGPGTAYTSYHRIDAASRRTDTYNIVFFGETGSGKSSLVNLITGKHEARTSPDAMGCTPEPTVYEHDIVTQDNTFKVQLFDTAGLDEGYQGTVPIMQGQKDLKTLLKTLKKHRGIHLLVYCALGTKDALALQRNYKLLQSKVKGKVPIVLVVTALEEREPDMEDWWRNNEKSISTLGMNFAGHACITSVTDGQDDTDELRLRRKQSYDAVCNLLEYCHPRNRASVHEVIPVPPARRTKNIVLFGEAGAGKSSIVNLMAGKDVAYTSPGMQRCTLQWQDYTIDFDGESYKVFDTIGIEESGLEMEEYLVAVANAYRFIKALDAEGGVDLLLFCIRAGRFTAALQSNYRFFYEFLCEKKVPIVLAITNLEREQKMEDWWVREHSIFPRYDIHVAGHACITAANGLDGRHQQLYEESRIAIRELVKENITGDHSKGWTGGNNVFVSLVRALRNLLVTNTHIRKMNLIGQLTKRCGMPRETAGQLADMIEQGEVRVDAA